MSYTSGLCSIKACEGTAPINIKSQPLPTCQMIGTCRCSCHELYDMMFTQTEIDRIPVNNSKYVSTVDPNLATTLREVIRDAALSSVRGVDAPVYIESPAPADVPATVARAYQPTPSGRAAAGELESQVDRVCKDWLVDKPGTPCTPVYISEQIKLAYGINPPSVGAIGAVFDRWEKIGYAIREKKPIRFTQFTPAGIEMGLEALKHKYRRNS